MHEMRRKDRLMPPEQAQALLENALYGVLATSGEDHAPYGVPINYACVGDTLYFHCASKGHKLENLAANPKASLTVVENAALIPQSFTCSFESVIAFGTVSVAEGDEKRTGLEALIRKYSPDFWENGMRCIERTGAHTTVLKMKIEHLSGKVHE